MLLAGSAGASARTITVGHTADADYRTIQDAVDAADAGDVIYVWNGSYYENVDVGTAHLTLEGEGADVVTVTAADPSESVFEVYADYVNISGFTVRGAIDYEMAGIHLTNADYCNISRTNAYRNYCSIGMWHSRNNTLTNNTMSNNDRGIYLYDSSGNNTLENNTASDNQYGIYLYGSNNNTLADNTADSNDVYGIYLRKSNNNTLENNTASDTYSVGIRVSSSRNNTLTNNTMSNNRHGICLSSSSGNTLTNNTANSNDYYGISLSNADSNNITCNRVQNNTQRGFCISGGSIGNTIKHNNIIENGNYNATSGGWEWQFYIEQYQPVEAKHNYWGAGMNNSTIDASIYDDEEGGWGEVEFYPFVERTGGGGGGGCGHPGDGCYPPGWGGTPAVQIRAGNGSDLPESIIVGETFTVLITENGSSIGAGTHVAFRIPYDTGDPVTVSTDDDGKVTYRPLITGTLGIDVLNTTGDKVAGAEIEVTTGTGCTEQLDRVELSPDSADLLVGDTQMFTATCYATDATGGSMISDCTVTWHWRNNGIGMINSSTGPSTGLFTATGVGTTTVIASATCGDITKNDTAIVNVTMPPAVITDTDGDGVPDVWDTDNSTPAGYWVNSDGVGRRWGDMNGDGKLTSVDALMILQAAVESN